jgi:Tripartite tricarboxylate transporter TctB family
MSDTLRDYIGGALMILIGLATVYLGLRYDFGSLMHMGPGFFPVLLGAALVIVGLCIGCIAHFSASGTEQIAHTPLIIDLRGWGCIIASVISFIILSEYIGLIVSTFVSVFIACCGDRTAEIKKTFVFSAFMTGLSVLLFSIILKSPLPLLRLFHAEF